MWSRTQQNKWTRVMFLLVEYIVEQKWDRRFELILENLKLYDFNLKKKKK